MTITSVAHLPSNTIIADSPPTQRIAAHAKPGRPNFRTAILILSIIIQMQGWKEPAITIAVTQTTNLEGHGATPQIHR
jgi:hypothetical protein